MPTEQEVREAVEEGMKVFQTCCELEVLIAYNVVTFPIGRIAELLDELTESAIKLSVLKSQNADNPQVQQTIMLCIGKIQGLTQTALRGASRGQARFPLDDNLLTRVLLS